MLQIFLAMHCWLRCCRSLHCWSRSNTDRAAAGINSETEEEVEKAFQQAVQGVSAGVPTSQNVQLTAAVHDMDIDNLLQKLVCGQIEYNPHDPNR